MWSNLKRSASAMKGALSSWPSGIQSKRKTNMLSNWHFCQISLFKTSCIVMQVQILTWQRSLQRFPSDFEISALCNSGVASMILCLSIWLHTMNAFIGRLMWYGVGFFVWKIWPWVNLSYFILLMRSELHNLQVVSEKIAAQLWESWGQWWCS